MSIKQKPLRKIGLITCGMVVVSDILVISNALRLNVYILAFFVLDIQKFSNQEEVFNFVGRYWFVDFLFF